MSVVADIPEQPHPDRVRLRFLQVAEDHAVKEARVPAGTTIFDAASWNGVAIDSTCGGHGTCKKCKVRVVSGHASLSPVDPRAFTVDELKGGWRLACRAAAQENLTVEVPPLQTRPKAALAGVGRHVILRPAVQKRYLELSEPTLEDQTSDLERVLAAIDDLELRVPLDVARGLGTTLREADWKVTAVVCDDLLIDVEPGDTAAVRYALAFDLGTTTVVATLLDLETGQPRAVRSVLNAQQPFGADVITRISATMLDPDALARLQQYAHETLELLTGEVCEEAGVDPHTVYEIVVAGNVTMIQLALGIDPQPLSMAPFTITARTAETGGINRSIVTGDRVICGITKKTVTDIETQMYNNTQSVVLIGDATTPLAANWERRSRPLRTAIIITTPSTKMGGMRVLAWRRPKRHATRSRSRMLLTTRL